MNACYALVVVVATVVAVSEGNDYPDGFDSNSCMPPHDDGGRKFPTVGGDYMSRLEWNDHLARRSYYLNEYISVTNNIGTVYVTGIKAPGITTQYISSADTGELFMIYDSHAGEFQDGNCVVSKLDSSEEFALPFKSDPNFPGSDKLLSGNSLLKMGANSVGSMQFNGTEEMNGVLCDIWFGCLFVPSEKLTISVKYHFSNNVWNTAGGARPGPVGIHASAIGTDGKPVLEQTFNYAYFSTQYPSIEPEFFAKVFETPEHAYCPGRKNTFQIPNVPQQFSFRSEVIDNLANTIMLTREWYDFQSNYTRMDFKSPPTGNDTVDASTSASTIVNDFNTGVSYIIDKFSKECTTIPLIGGEFDSMPTSAGKARITSPKEFFNFDNVGKYPYQYMGEHMVRNVPCNSWISYRPFPDLSSSYNATYEWYFSTKDTIIKARELVEDLEPMRLVIKSAEANVDIESNIYRFGEEAPDSEVFDVRSCFIDSGSTSFEMQLRGNWSDYNAENNLQVLRYWFQLGVEAFAGVRPIRVQDVEFVFYGKVIGVKFTLLGPTTIKGDVDNKIEQVSLQVATDRLTEAFTDNVFLMYFMASPGSEVTTFSPVPNTLRVIERSENPQSYRPMNGRNRTVIVPGKTTYGAGLSKSAAAGLAFGVLFVGALLGVLGIIVFRRYTTSPIRNYAKQHDDE